MTDLICAPAEQPAIASLFASAILAPVRLVQQLRHSRAAMLAPVIVLALGTAAVIAWYYMRLDYGWFAEYLRANNPIVARYDHGSLQLTQALLLGPAVATALIGVIAGWLLTGAYLYLAGRLLRDDTSFRQWLTLASWSSVPALLVLPLAAAIIAIHADGRIAPDQLDPTTLAAILDIPASAAIHGAAAKVGLAGIWGTIVLAIGVHRWTHLGYPRALALVAAPQLALLGLALLPALIA